MSSPAPALPTLLGTRRVPLDLGSQTFTYGGGPTTFFLRKKGWLSLLVIHLTGTYTPTTSNLVFNQFMPYDSAQFLFDGPGQTPPFRLGGFGLHQWNLREKSIAPFVSGARVLQSAVGGLDSNTFDNSLVDAYPVTTGAQRTAHLWWVMPFQRSSMDPRGVLGLGTDYQVALIATPTTAGGLVTTLANFVSPSFTMRVTQVYYPPVQPGYVDFDPYWAVIYDEAIQPISATGVQTVNINPGGRILGLIHGIALNNALDLTPGTGIDNATLQLNDTFLVDPKGLPTETLTWWMRYQIGENAPAGVVIYDEDSFVDDGPLDVREWINTQNIQTIQGQLTVSSAATLGTGPVIKTWTKRLFRLAA